MLEAIITEKDNHYYLYMQEENGTKIISVIHTKKNKVNCLNEAEAKKLLQDILSSKLTYKEKSGDYEIYLDEENNKRYYKEGKEDFRLFFENNGISAIEYDEKTANIVGFAKRFTISFLNTSYALILGTMISSLSTTPILYRMIDPMYTNEITTEKMIDYINESPYLTEEEKEFLANRELLEEIKRIAEDDRNYSLSSKMSNIQTKRYKKHGDAAGYYTPLLSSNIYIQESIEQGSDLYYDVFGHEYVHLLQNDCRYYYIIETVAEIMSSEYLETNQNSYKEQVKRAKILMEIIGPKALLDCSFSDTAESFENKIKQYLNEDEAKKLLQLFRTHADNFTPEIDREIDKYLAIMYYNKTGKDIKDNKLISHIYNDEANFRLYFNWNLNQYNLNYEMIINKMINEQIDMEQLQQEKNIRTIRYFEYHECSREEFLKLDGTIDFVERGHYYDFPEGTITKADKTLEYNNETYTFQEMKEKGLLIDNYYYKTCRILNSIEDINTINPNKNDIIRIEKDDGTTIDISCEEDNQWGPIYKQSYQSCTEVYPSIKSLFPEDTPTFVVCDENIDEQYEEQRRR